MPVSRWWTTVSTVELLDLRRRLVEYVRSEFGASLEPELEDVVQQAFVVLLQRRESVDPAEDGLFRYLKTVARNAALDRLRTARRRQKHFPEVISKLGHPPGQAPGTPSAEPAEESERIWEFFRALDELERLMLWSHVVEGKSIRAVARDFDLSWHRVAGVIEGALRRARRELSS